MAEPYVPAPGERTIPSAGNFFKAAFLVAAMLASFFAVQSGAEAIEELAPDSRLAAASKWLLVAAAGVWSCMLLTGMGILAHAANLSDAPRAIAPVDLVGDFAWPRVPTDDRVAHFDLEAGLTISDRARA